MRAGGGCSLQQSLTQESITVVKQAIILARRRGHAQVTPLHVASTLLSSSASLLRAACLDSHSHPLQCKALELCFNVALNRLPASTSSSPMLAPPSHHHHHHPPLLSNALVAAFKRAQAHQRRGSIDSQQQPLLAVKIELDQLVISILDDPSVSRVMREAGFSSTQVKTNVERTLSGVHNNYICSPARRSSPSCKLKKAGAYSFPASNYSSKTTTTTTSSVQAKKEDVMSVVETLVMGRKKSIVIVGECLDAADAVIRGVMEKVNSGELAADEVLRKIQFITLSLFSFRKMTLEEVDQKVAELKTFVKSCCSERGMVLRLKDLDWAAEYRASRGEKGRSYYCPLEHVIMEIRNLLCCGGFEGENNSYKSNERLWLMAAATYRTFMRCRNGNPSLETLWGLFPLTVPAEGLGLSLNFHSTVLSEMRRSKICGGAQLSVLSLSPSTGDQDEIASHVSFGSKRSSSPPPSKSAMPSWFQRYKEDNAADDDHQDDYYLQLKEISENWIEPTCRSSSHNHPSEITFNFSSLSPSSSSISSSHNNADHHYQQSLVPSAALETKRRHAWRSEHHHFWPESDEGRENYCPTSNSRSPTMAMDYFRALPRFKELNAENIKTLCGALEKSVAWQRDIIPEIASTVLRCRTGLMRRRDNTKSRKTTKKEETWLIFQGCDFQGKERIAKELARLIFGSYNNFIVVGLDSFSSRTRSDSTESLRNKRLRAEASRGYIESLFEAIRQNPHRVILMSNEEQVDRHAIKGLKRAMESGVIESHYTSGDGDRGEVISLCDAIIILSCESFDSRSRACSPLVKHKVAEATKSSDHGDKREEQEEDSDEKEEASRGLSLDLNVCAAADEDDEDMEECCFDKDQGLLESVDGAFFFKLPEEII